MIISIIKSIKNIFRWIPIIWRDRDWDHTFLYEILRFKLSNMEECLRNHSHYVNSEKDADRIKICVNLINRLMNDEYHDMVFKKHYEKWGKPKFNWIDTKDTPNVITKEDEKKESNEFRNLMQIENNLRQQDIDYLFETIRKYHQGWWDQEYYRKMIENIIVLIILLGSVAFVAIAYKIVSYIFDKVYVSIEKKSIERLAEEEKKIRARLK